MEESRRGEEERWRREEEEGEEEEGRQEEEEVEEMEVGSGGRRKREGHLCCLSCLWVEPAWASSRPPRLLFNESFLKPYPSWLFNLVPILRMGKLRPKMAAQATWPGKLNVGPCIRSQKSSGPSLPLPGDGWAWSWFGATPRPVFPSVSPRKHRCCGDRGTHLAFCLSALGTLWQPLPELCGECPRPPSCTAHSWTTLLCQAFHWAVTDKSKT